MRFQRNKARFPRRQAMGFRKRTKKTGKIWCALKTMTVRFAPAVLVFVVTGLLSSVSVASYRFVTESSKFAIRDIAVDGVANLSAEDVIAMTRLQVGQNIMQVNLSHAAKYCELHPWIKQAKISRSLPDGIRITVTEVEAVGVANLGGLYLVNREGHPFKRVDFGKGEGVGLPMVTGLTRDDFNQFAEETQQRIKNAIELVEAFSMHSDRPEVGEVHFDSRHGFTLWTKAPVLAIHLREGDLPSLQKKIATFDRVWQSLQKSEQDATTTIYIDDEDNAGRVVVSFTASQVRG